MACDPQPVTLELDLRPHTSQVGELHGQAPSKPVSKYLAISPPKELFHFSIQSGLELHGLYNGKPATLVTLKPQFVPEKQARPIKWAAITAYFAPYEEDSKEKGSKRKDSKEKDLSKRKDSKAKDSKEKDSVEIHAFALGQPTVKVECSVDSDKVRKSVGVNAGVSYMAKAGAKANREHEVNSEQKYAATVSGSMFPAEKDGDIANTVRWILEGNPSQKTSGVPPDITFGVILVRTSDAKFVGYVQVDIKVDWKYAVKEWYAAFKSFTKWGNVGRHKVYDPREAVSSEVSSGVNVEHMEELTKHGKTPMEDLVKIEMPIEYCYIKGKKDEDRRDRKAAGAAVEGGGEEGGIVDD